jgi:deleted-in-malignant-brain-tumors protein 1
VDDPRSSLFTYGPNGDWESFHDVTYVPVFESTFSDPELEEQANEICGDDQLCIFDIAATGDVEIGISTMDSVQEQERLRESFVPSKWCIIAMI